MDKREMRRVNPIARLTAVLVLVLLVAEGLVIGGALELKGSTVARYTPWAYEYFIRLVGEHPESSVHWARVEEGEEPSAASSVETMAGLQASTIPVLMDGSGSEATNQLEDPLPESAVAEPVEEAINTGDSTNVVPEPIEEEILPVG